MRVREREETGEKKKNQLREIAEREKENQFKKKYYYFSYNICLFFSFFFFIKKEVYLLFINLNDRNLMAKCMVLFFKPI